LLKVFSNNANYALTFQYGKAKEEIFSAGRQPGKSGLRAAYPPVHSQRSKDMRIVLDNLNTHSKKSLFETFNEKEAERVLQKIEFHYTPKHGSWLNIAEIEINVMDTECTGRRMKNMEFLTKELAAWEKERNRRKSEIEWKFTKQDADEKLSKYYVT